MKLAIVGSRNYNNYDDFLRVLSDFLARNLQKDEKLECIVSGGAKGADSLAERYANENNIKIVVFKPDWKKYGKGAGIIRNADIVSNATHLLAYPSKYGSGTQNSISRATNANVITFVYYVD